MHLKYGLNKCKCFLRDTSEHIKKCKQIWSPIFRSDDVEVCLDLPIRFSTSCCIDNFYSNGCAKTPGRRLLTSILCRAMPFS